jgi:type IV pilus assembly protein PilA
MMKVQRNSEGFTLIELLIVIVIIGILVGIAIPAYTGYTKKSKVSGVVSAMGAVKSAIVAYYTETRSVPVVADIATINTVFGITIPGQYVSAANVGVTTNTVTINVTLANIGGGVDGGIFKLETSNIADGSPWVFSSANASISPLIPK